MSPDPTGPPTPQGADTDDPRLTITGRPTTAEVAAVTAVILALSSAAPPEQPAAADNGWAAHWRRMGTSPAPGPDTWRMSARP